MNRKMCALAGFGLSLLLFSRAQAAPVLNFCDYTQTTPDGRTRVFSGRSNASIDLDVFFQARANRSYSVEAWISSESSLTASGSLSINLNGGVCPGSDVSGLTNTAANDPAPQPSFPNRFYRVSFTAPAASVYNLRVGNTTATPVEIIVVVAETTQYNPRWSTIAGYTSQWGFQNTSSATVTGTLTVYTTAGTQVATSTFDIAPGLVKFQSSGGLGIAAGQAGNAIFTHNGPPGSIQADGFMISGDGSVIVPTKFAPVREGAH